MNIEEYAYLLDFTVDCFQINYIIFRSLKEDLTEFDKMLYFQGLDGILYSKTSIL